MNRFVSLLIISAILPLFARSTAVFPWVTDNPTFRSTLVLNNFSSEEAEVILIATRADGVSAGATRMIAPYGQLVEDAASLFPDLHDGAGYVVIAVAPDDIQGAFVIAGTGSASGSSPAQANIARLGDASRRLVFSFLPVSSDGGVSALVLVNLGSDVAAVTLTAWQDGEARAVSESVALLAGYPLARVTTDVFPEISGNIYVTAECDQPIIGMAFTFNRFLEPSMANAVSGSETPDSGEFNHKRGPNTLFGDQSNTTGYGVCHCFRHTTPSR